MAQHNFDPSSATEYTVYIGKGSHSSIEPIAYLRERRERARLQHLRFASCLGSIGVRSFANRTPFAPPYKYTRP